MKRKTLLLMTLGLLLLLFALPTLADQNGFEDVPPAEVYAHLQGKYADYTLEDYIKIGGTPKGDYGFALVSKEGSRRLLGYHLENQRMVYWLRNDDVAPQGKDPVYFYRHSKDTFLDQGRPFADNLGFSMYLLDSNAQEYTQKELSFHWENGGFQLMSYFDRDYDWIRCIVDNQGVRYREFLAGDRTGYVYGVLQRDLRYVSFSALPKTIAGLKEKLSNAPGIPAGQLHAQKIKFTGGRKYEVYSAPSATSLRGGEGKALVSTNDWIQVFGQENGFVLIQYDITSDHMRFGYIDAAALPRQASVPALALYRQPAVLLSNISLTDDPLFSGAALAYLMQGQQVTQLATMGSWAYIETTVNGLSARGFVPISSLSLLTEK